MEDDQQTPLIDAGIYDAPEFQAGERVGFGESMYERPEPVDTSAALRGTRAQAQGEAREQEAQREKAGALAAAGAAISEYAGRRIYDYITRPTSMPDPFYKPAEFVNSIPFALNEQERQFLLNTTSDKDAEYALSVVERVRTANQAMGDSPFAAFLASMADPTYWGMDALTLGGARLARLNGIRGRIAAAGAATAGTYAVGIGEQAGAPVSDTEVILNALMNGAATGMLYRGGRLVREDPEFPASSLSENIPRREAATPAELAPPAVHVPVDTQALRATGAPTGKGLLEQIEGRYAGTDMEPLVNALRNAPELANIRVVDTPRKGTKASTLGEWIPPVRDEPGTLFIRKGASGEVALHELYHAVIQSRVFKSPELVRELEGIRTEVRAIVAKMPDKQLANFYGNQFKKLSEFLAYASTSPEFRAWARQQRITPEGRAAEFPAAQGTLWDRVKNLLRRATGRAAEPPSVAPRFRTLEARLNQIHAEVTAPGTTPDLARAESVVGRVGPMDQARELAEAAQEAGPTMAGKLARKLEWSLMRTFDSLSPEAGRLMRRVIDDPVDMTGDSVVSQQRAIRADLTPYQYAFEDKLRKAMAAQGAGLFQQIFRTSKALKVQKGLERQVASELLAMERAAADGVPFRSSAPTEIQAMASDLNDLAKAALDEWKGAGVPGAEGLNYREGYFSRRWDSAQIEDVLQRLEHSGMERDAARRYLVQELGRAVILRGGRVDQKMQQAIAGALVDRALRKGMGEDIAFRQHFGTDIATELRDLLKRQGLDGDDLDEALGLIQGKTDQAGIAGSLKGRVDVDMGMGVAMPDGSTVQFLDLIDTGLTRITDQYLDSMSGRAALARKGLGDPSDVQKLRQEVAAAVEAGAKRDEALKLFDQTIDSILGRPVGDDMPDLVRNSLALTRAVGLGASGMWQVTEFAAVMAKYGALRTFDHMLRKMPGAREVYRDVLTNPSAARDLRAILAHNSSADIRMRPFLQRLEDNFNVDASKTVQLSLQQVQQMVPYANAQKWVQQTQARLVSSLVSDTLVKGARGDARALEALRKYGLELHIMEDAVRDIRTHGLDTGRWSDGTWEQVRGPLLKMMDDAVLRNRTGEIPAFAQFSALGKFIFTFRSFVLGAHNKVLAGTLNRHGFAGLSLLMLYQTPLTMLMVSANGTMRGQPPESVQDAASQALGMVSALGLMTEFWGVASGDKQQFGSPGMIFADRMYRLGGAAFSGDVGGASAAALNTLPIISLIAPVKAIGEALKE